MFFRRCHVPRGSPRLKVECRELAASRAHRERSPQVADEARIVSCERASARSARTSVAHRPADFSNDFWPPRDRWGEGETTRPSVGEVRGQETRAQLEFADRRVALCCGRYPDITVAHRRTDFSNDFWPPPGRRDGCGASRTKFETTRVEPGLSLNNEISAAAPIRGGANRPTAFFGVSHRRARLPEVRWTEAR